MRGRLRALARALLPLGWGGLIWLGSARDARFYTRPRGRLPLDRVPTAWIAPFAHLFAFGGLAALCWWSWPWGSPRHRALVAFAATTAYGIVDERHQARVPGRDASAFDVVTDAAGAIAGIAVVTAISRRGTLRARVSVRSVRSEHERRRA